MDDGGAGADAPDGAALDELAEPVPFAFGEVEQLGRRGDLLGWLAQQHPGLDVRQQPGGDLGRGGAVVELRGQVRRPVADQHGGDAVGAGQLQGGLEVGGAVAHRGPRLVDHLHRPALRVAAQGAGQPVGGGGHHQREGVGVLVDGGQVDHHAGAVVPVDGDGGGAVEHAAQGAAAQLVQRERDRGGGPGQLEGGVAGQADQLVGRVEDLAAQVAQRERLSGAAALLDRPAQHGVLQRGQARGRAPRRRVGRRGTGGR